MRQCVLVLLVLLLCLVQKAHAVQSPLREGESFGKWYERVVPSLEEARRFNGIADVTKIPAGKMLEPPFKTLAEVKADQDRIKLLTEDRDKLMREKKELETNLLKLTVDLREANSRIEELRPDAEQAVAYKARFRKWVFPLAAALGVLILLLYWRESMLRYAQKALDSVRKERDDWQRRGTEARPFLLTLAGMSEEGISKIDWLFRGYSDLSDPETQKAVREAARSIARAHPKNTPQQVQPRVTPIKPLRR